MTKVLIVGCGDLGGAVAKQLSAHGLEVIGVRRSNAPIEGVRILQADVAQANSLAALKAIQAEVLIYCVAANGQTDAQYQAHYVEGLRNVLATQADNPTLKQVFFVSSTRVYGQQTDTLLDETTLAMPADFGGERLLEAEQLLNSLTCQHTVLRLSGIYGAGRLRMIQLAKTPEKWPVENSWTNRIHRDDAAAFMVLLVHQALADKPLKPCYIVTDSAPVCQYEVLSWIASQMQLKPNVKTPSIKGGKRLSNQTMLGTGFQLRYADYKSGYQALLATLHTV